MTKYLIAVIKEYGIDCLRIGYNISPDVYWRHLDADDPDRVGMAEIRYVEGLYKMWDDLLQTYPHRFIDNCASGGMRIDLETSARSIPLWRTDATIDPVARLDFNQAALHNQVMTAGLSRYVPFSTSGQMGATPSLHLVKMFAQLPILTICSSRPSPKGSAYASTSSAISIPSRKLRRAPKIGVCCNTTGRLNRTA